MRLLALVLATLVHAHAEWVQISQQSYRKPTHKSDFKPTEAVPVDTSYASDYVKFTDNPWGKGSVYRVQNIGTVKRVQPAKVMKAVEGKVTRVENISEGKTKEGNSQDDSEINHEIIKDDDKKTIQTKIKFENEYNSEQTTPLTKETDAIDEKENIASDNKFEEVLKFLKIVSETISKNTHKSFGNKLRYLHELRNLLLHSIEEKIEETWPDDDTVRERRARSAPLQEQRSHVEFPSSEGALMSISFLTFAVFLIKLVLQVIHTYKNKTMMMTPTLVAVSKINSKTSS